MRVVFVSVRVFWSCGLVGFIVRVFVHSSKWVFVVVIDVIFVRYVWFFFCLEWTLFTG